MAVRAKFKVDSVTKHSDGEDIQMSAVYGEDGTPNAEWSKWTPSGTLRMYVTNEAVFGQFEQGKEFYLDITPAE